MKLTLPVPPGFALIRPAYSPEFNAQIKQFPGVRYSPDHGKGSWLIPLELAEIHKQPPNRVLGKFNLLIALHQFQETALENALREGGQFLNFDAGLGKGVTAIAILRAINSVHPLIICNPLLIQQWQDFLDEWWPEVPAETKVISYRELSSWVGVDAGIPFDGIIFDESSALKNPKSAQSKAALAISKANPTAMKLCLSAVLPANFHELWHQLEVIWPGRFGSQFKACSRYSNVSEMVARGNVITRFEGYNPHHEPELKRRLSSLISSARKAHYAHLLPVFQTKILKQIPEGNYLKFFHLPASGKREHINEAFAAAREEKVTFALEQIELALEGNDHVIALCHSEETVEAIRAQLPASSTPRIFLGINVSAEEKIKSIAFILGQPKGLLVCCIKHVAVGLNSLTNFGRAIFVELSPDPALLEQALGRFSRLNSAIPSECIFLIFERTIDELLASLLLTTLSSTLTVAEHASNSPLTAALLTPEDDFFARLSDAAESFTEGMDREYDAD